MGTGKNKEAKKDFVPEPSVDAARRLKKRLQTEQDSTDSLAMFVTTFSAFGMMRANPLFNWGAWFILLSLYINRGRSSTHFTQSGISLIMVTISTIFLYYRLTKGYVPK